jgi:CMP-N-acetylneuraminic acid synthetase
MIGDKRLLAVIPARGGSKRLSRKNVLDLAGKPLIAWTIEAALGSKYIDRVIVSTDDDEIAEVSKDFGADVPFMRPTEYATDEATSVDVVLQLLEQLEVQNEQYEYIILLQPTSPLRTTENINESIELLIKRRSDGVVSVCEAEHSPFWSNILPDDDSLSGFLDESIINKRSQDLEKFYRLNGAIYLCNSKRLMQEKTFFLKDDIYAFKMSREVSIDIDTGIDLDLARLIKNGNK